MPNNYKELLEKKFVELNKSAKKTDLAESILQLMEQTIKLAEVKDLQIVRETLEGQRLLNDKIFEKNNMLMAVIEQCKKAFTRINYNNYRGVNQTIELHKISADTLTSINEKLEKLNGK